MILFMIFKILEIFDMKKDKDRIKFDWETTKKYNIFTIIEKLCLEMSNFKLTKLFMKCWYDVGNVNNENKYNHIYK